MGIRLEGYGFAETDTAAIEQIVLAVAPGSSAVSSINGQTGDVILKSVDGQSLTPGPGNIDTSGTSTGGGGGVATPFSVSILYDLDYRYYTTVRQTLTNDVYVQNLAGAIPYGRTQWSIQLDGTHLPDFSNLGTLVGPVTLLQETGRVYEVRAWRTLAGAYYELYKGIVGTVVDTTPPTLLSAAVSGALPTRVTLAWSEPMSATISAPTAFTIVGHTLSGHTIIDPTHTFLTVNEPFVAGETAILGYTQPSSSKMQDLAGNLLANIIGFPVSDAIASPTLGTAAVALTTPTVVTLTWNQAMNSAISAASAFTIVGHALVTHSFIDATHTQLSTSTPFVGGETPTLAYVPPATNKMMDSTGSLVLTLSGFPIGITGGSAGPSLDFSDPNNSMYLALLTIGVN